VYDPKPSLTVGLLTRGRTPFMNIKSSLPAVQLKNVYKTFQSGQETVRILRDLNLSVPTSAMLGITGVSGSGKSTLLHVIGGMDEPDRGYVLYSERNLNLMKKNALARFRNQTIGFVFQFHHLLPEFTALENVLFPFLIRGENLRPSREKAEQMLVDVGLKDRMASRAGELSGGEQQRVAIARALVADPAVLLADEPTGNLDPKTAEFIFVLLLRLHIEKKLTSIIATHNEKLARICDEVLHLEDGRLVKEW